VARRNALLLLGVAGLAGCGSAAATPTPTAPPTSASAVPSGAATPSPTGSPAPTSAPAIPHIMVVMEENVGYASTLGSCGSGSPDPYLCSLAARYASATSWYGVQHPSQPNYVDIASGRDQGCTSDGCAGAGAYSTQDLGGQLSRAGIPWVAWMESMPSPCYTGSSSGSDATGSYALKHNPFVVFRDNMPPNACHIQPYPGAGGAVSALDGATPPDFVWVTPNLCNDGHDSCGRGQVGQIDAWLQANLAGVLASSWFADHGTVIVTMDENDAEGGGSCCGDAAGGRIPMVVISSASLGRGAVALTGDHFGTLRTIEEAYRLPLLGAAADAANGDLSGLLG
jgi:hypothetical protein